MDAGQGSLVAGLSVVLTLLARELVPAVGRIISSRNDAAAISRKDTLSEFRELMERIDRDRIAAEEDARQLRADNILIREQLAKTQRMCDRLATENEYLQDALTQAGIKFRRQSAADDTGDFSPLRPAEDQS